MKIKEFIQQVNQSIPESLREKIQLTNELTTSEILASVAQHCLDLYSAMGQNLPQLLLNTFDYEKLWNHNLHLNATRIAGEYDPNALHHFLYTSPMATVINEGIRFAQYGNADITVVNSEGCIYDNQQQVNIKGNCVVTLFEQTKANVDGRSMVFANDKSFVTAKGNPYIKATGGSYIVVQGDANIQATENANIEITAGSPIIHARENVRIANCTTKEMDECVRVDMGSSVIFASYKENHSMLIQNTPSQNANGIYFHDFEPAMDRFVENMRARHEDYEVRPKFIRRSEIKDIDDTKATLSNLIKNDAYAEGIGEMIENAPDKDAILDILVEHMRLFVENGLNHRILNQHFDEINMADKGIYTSSYMFESSENNQDIILFGYDNFCTSGCKGSVESFEHTVITAKSINDMYCNDHSIGLALEFDNIYLRDHSFAGGVDCKLIELNEQSMAQFSYVDMAKNTDQSHLVVFGRTGLLLASDKSQTFCYYPPKSISKQGNESQIYYLKEMVEPQIYAPKAGVKELDTVDAMNEAIRKSKQIEQQTHQTKTHWGR